MAKNKKRLLSASERSLYKQELELFIAGNSYVDYIQLVHGGKWKRARHLDLVCRELERVISGRTKRLMLFLPPRHGKSMTVTETFPSYFLGRNPDKRVIEISYSDEFAQRFGKLNRDKVNEFGYSVFGVALSKVQATKTNWNIDGRDGGMISTGLGGAITGYGADLLIIDDPIKNRQEAESTTYRERLWAEYQSTVATRLHAGAAVIIILTRWHEDDLAGRLLNPEYGTVEDWRIISLPAIAENKNDLLSRDIGEALWPAAGYDEAWARQQKAIVGTYAWSSLYQQRPAPSAGGLFRRGWWKYWRALPGDLFDYLQSWDCAFKGVETSDYVVGQVWARSKSSPANRYLLDQVRGRFTFTETIEAMRQLSYKWPQTTRKLVEDKANGTAVMEVLKKEIVGLVPVDPEGGKIDRAHAITPVAEAGNIYLPDASIAPWVHDYVEEFASFPNGVHDDQVDATTQANIYYNNDAFDISNLIS